jgi:cystathionine gamma-lyase
MSSDRQWRTDTQAIHAGQQPDPTTGAIMTPVYLTSTYVQETPGVHKGYEYSRTGNPTRTALEKCLAELEGAKHGLCFASGLAAATTVMHLFKQGDHILCGDDLYGGTHRLFNQIWSKHGMEFSAVDLSDPEAVKEGWQPNTRAVWIESPTNPMLKLADIQRVAELTHEMGGILIVDNTFMTPYFQRPIPMGADIVLHSTTKYIGGHSDVVGGFLGTSSDELKDQLAYLQNAVGAIPGPMDCFLLLRGLKTLHVRMDRHAENALAVAQCLEGHANVESVWYPGLESHPQHELAKKQTTGHSGIVTFVLKGDLSHARRFLEALEVFTLAESLGGVESLADHPAIMTHAAVPAEIRQELGIVDGLVRLSVGIEHIEDLLSDLEQALACAG